MIQLERFNLLFNTYQPMRIGIKNAIFTQNNINVKNKNLNNKFDHNNMNHPSDKPQTAKQTKITGANRNLRVDLGKGSAQKCDRVKPVM